MPGIRRLSGTSANLPSYRIPGGDPNHGPILEVASGIQADGVGVMWLYLSRWLRSSLDLGQSHLGIRRHHSQHPSTPRVSESEVLEKYRLGYWTTATLGLREACILRFGHRVLGVPVFSAVCATLAESNLRMSCRVSSSGIVLRSRHVPSPPTLLSR